MIQIYSTSKERKKKKQINKTVIHGKGNRQHAN